MNKPFLALLKTTSDLLSADRRVLTFSLTVSTYACMQKHIRDTLYTHMHTTKQQAHRFPLGIVPSLKPSLSLPPLALSPSRPNVKMM